MADQTMSIKKLEDFFDQNIIRVDENGDVIMKSEVDVKEFVIFEAWLRNNNGGLRTLAGQIQANERELKQMKKDLASLQTHINELKIEFEGLCELVQDRWKKYIHERENQ